MTCSHRMKDRFIPTSARSGEHDRSKTVVIRDQEGLKRVMFYGDYDPVAAKMVSHPREWKKVKGLRPRRASLG